LIEQSIEIVALHAR